MLDEVRTLVVVPSISFPPGVLAKIAGVRWYEERLLVAALLLRRPDLRMVFVTSSRIDPATVAYYLRFVPDPADARRRLRLFHVGDPSIGSLTGKLLGRPDLLDDIRSAAGDGGGGWLLPFNVTALEQRLSVAVGLPLYGPHPDLVWLGSKTGAREVARRAGVAVLDGRERLFSVEEIAGAVEEIRGRRAGLRAVMIKLNNGFSGQGNAIVDVRHGPRPVVELPTVFCGTGESWPSFARKVAEEGAIVEEVLPSDGAGSPSVQLHISPGGEVAVVSTHDQILGGPGNKVYVGCRFPAHPSYRGAIQEEARKVAAVLAAEGVIGWFGIDFLVARAGDGRPGAVFVSEINLRLGGTTHPFWMARLATGGAYDVATGHIHAQGRAKSYVASDNLKSARLVGRSPADVIEAVDRAGLGFDPATRTGTTLHLLGPLSELGKMGATSIADDPAQAEEMYREVEKLLL
ncbi:MAG: peptide ligase PGM1-related protein [Actinomycetota bacterium]